MSAISTAPGREEYAFLVKKEGYKDLFDGELYLEKYYKGDSLLFVPEFFEVYHDIFKSGDHQGDVLLDLCSGPSIHSIISASKYYKQIYLSDYSLSNLNVLKKWVARDSTAFDWTPFFQKEAANEGNGVTALEIEERVRKGIKGVLACDLLADKPLGPDQGKYEMADAIISSMTIAVLPPEMVFECLKKFYNLLAPGGRIWLSDASINGSYHLHDAEFVYHEISNASIESKLLEAGFSNIEFIDVPSKAAEYYFFVFAKK